MMLLSELARYYGVFEWVASVAVEHARGSCARLFTLIYAVGAVVTVFMSNDATAVVLTPAVLSAVRRSKAEPLPHLFACAMIANAASFVLPISNPANLVVYRAHMPPLGHWIAAFGLPSVLSIAATYLVLRWTFRRDLRCAVPDHSQRPDLTRGRQVRTGRNFRHRRCPVGCLCARPGSGPAHMHLRAGRSRNCHGRGEDQSVAHRA